MEAENRPHKSIDELLDVFPSFALLAGMRLELFSQLGERRCTVAELAAELELEAQRLGPLLYALTASGLLECGKGPQGGDVFANGQEAQRLLVRGQPDYMGGEHPLLAQLWEGGLKAADSIRSGLPEAAHDYSVMPAGQLEAFFAGLHPDALDIGHRLAGRDEWPACRRLLDVGGGSGGVSIAVVGQHPHLEATVTELPTVTPLTRRYIAAAGLEQRISVAEVDMLVGPPSGLYDVAVLKSFLQVFGPGEAQRALGHVAAAVRPGGTIFILGQGIVTDDRLQPATAAVANIALLSFYSEGQAYTLSEYSAWLEAAGCVVAEIVEDKDQLMVVARRSDPSP
jgi:hypothetical protein